MSIIYFLSKTELVPVLSKIENLGYEIIEVINDFPGKFTVIYKK